VPEGEDVQDLSIPIDVDYPTMVSDAELVGLHGTQPFQIPGRIRRRLFQPSDESIPNLRFLLPELDTGQVGQSDLERRTHPTRLR
jgi:hypothetical protein